MPGFMPGIHAFLSVVKKDVDGRDKPSHDEVFTAHSTVNYETSTGFVAI